jgi:hypothetical protein
MKKCLLCDGKHKAKGYCVNHYQNLKTTGSPYGKVGRRRRNSIDDMLKIIDLIKVNESGCKIWPMGINSAGYGHFSIKDKSYNVSRLLYKTTYPGEYTGLVVRHKCDNRACCNIEHLEIGTQSENLMDASKRKRLRFGSENNKTHLKEEQVLEMRKLYPSKSTLELAKLYNTSPGTIRDAIIGKTWKHLPGSKNLIRNKRALGEKMGRSKLTGSMVVEIRDKYPMKTGPELAKEYGVGHAMIYCIVKRKNWTHI